MKKVRIILLTMLVMGVLTACGAGKLSENYVEDDVITKAEQVVELFNDKDYQAVTDMVREDLQEQLSADVLKSALDEKLTAAGEFMEYSQSATAGQQDKSTGEDYAIVVLICKYQNSNLTFTISMDEDMNLVGIYMK